MNDVKRTSFSLVLLLAVALAAAKFASPFGSRLNGKVAFLNVGQGDSELITFTSGASILIDTGPDRSVIDALNATHARRRLDAVIITHGQKDHFGGLPFILERYDVGIVLYNGVEENPPSDVWMSIKGMLAMRSIPLIPLGAKDKVRVGDEYLEILNPTGVAGKNDETNELAVVLKANVGGLSYLFTADAGFLTEKRLLQDVVDIRSNVLKVGHHGSKFSTSESFLSAVAPNVAVIEVGSSNTYGHPSLEALQRIGFAGAKIYRTDKNGTIIISSNSAGAYVLPEHPQGALGN